MLKRLEHFNKIWTFYSNRIKDVKADNPLKIIVLFEIVGEPPSTESKMLQDSSLKELQDIFGETLPMDIEIELRIVFSIMLPVPVCSFQLLLSSVNSILLLLYKMMLLLKTILSVLLPRASNVPLTCR